jgi:hypothetical protein
MVPTRKKEIDRSNIWKNGVQKLTNQRAAEYREER